MKPYIYTISWVAAILLILTGCSTTAHLPEDEVLYTGVSDISFGKKSKKVSKYAGVEEGAITAVGNAFDTVERLLKGGAMERKEVSVNMDELTEFERDSLKAEQALKDAAMSVAKSEVTGVLSIPPNNSFLGSAKYRFPLPVGLWFYNGFVGSKTKFGKWIFNTFSANPKFISTVNPSLRTKVAKNVLRNYGYFRADVTYDLLPQKNPRKAKVAYSVFPNQLYRLDSIAYLNFSANSDSLIQRYMHETKLHKGDAFTAASLDAERNRLNVLFRNNGYYYCQPTFFTYRADTIQRPDWVQLQVVPSRELPPNVGQRFYIRNTYINLYDLRRGTEMNDSIGAGIRRNSGSRNYAVSNNRGRNTSVNDSVRTRRSRRSNSLKMRFTDDDLTDDVHKPSVRFGIIRNYIFHEKGDLYRQEVSDLIQEKLRETGIFSQVAMRYEPIDSTATCDSLDVTIYTVLDKPFDAEFKASVKNKSSGFVGPGLSFGMTKRNAFRGAEALNFQIYGSYEWQTGANEGGNSNLMNSYEYGTSLSLDYPYIKLGRFARKFLRKAVTSTSFKLDADWMNRSGFFGRVSFGARVTLTYERKQGIKHEFTPFRLDYNLQLHTTEAFNEIMNANQALAVSMRDQFVPSMQYVFSANSRRNSRHPGNFTFTLKEAGNFTSGIYACFGEKFNTKNSNLFGVPYAQYVKATAEFTKKHYVGASDVQLAGRVMLGAVYSYGNATIAPYNDLFFIGGANSIRAFSVRSIGPGSYRPANSRYSYVDQVGDLKFEANLECRFPIVGSLEGAVFMDCGNVWLMNNNDNHPGGAFKFRNLGKELALGTGVGLRYDLDFLVVRFDLGVGIHAPYDTGKGGYYNMPKFGKSLGYHLAIGYPF